MNAILLSEQSRSFLQKKKSTKKCTRGGAPLHELSFTLNFILYAIASLIVLTNKKGNAETFPINSMYVPTLALSKSGMRVEALNFLSAWRTSSPDQFTRFSIKTCKRIVKNRLNKKDVTVQSQPRKHLVFPQCGVSAK